MGESSAAPHARRPAARPDSQLELHILIPTSAAELRFLVERASGLWRRGVSSLRTRGVRAHSARAWVGHNAIHDAAAVLQVLQSYRPREVDVEGLRYREGLNAVLISGGVATNVIPDECVVHVNYRFAPSRSVVEATEHVVALFEGFDVRVVDSAPGARPGLDAPLAQEFIAAVGATPQPKYGWTDVARFSAMGVPAVNYGPGDPHLAHHDEERVPVSQIEDVERGLRAWLSGS